MKEDDYVEPALAAAKEVLGHPLSIVRGAALLYQVTVDNTLSLTVDPQHPKRGQSAFQTDLAVFEEVAKGVLIPRVVMEFKLSLTTHDVLTYSAKARKHKQVYPYLRYGIVVGRELAMPGRFFTHNDGLDFGVAAASFKGNLQGLFRDWLSAEVETSRRLEAITFGKIAAHMFRTEVEVRKGGGKIR